MTDDILLRELAQKAGIAIEWTDNDGVRRDLSAETLRHLLTALGLQCHSTGAMQDSLQHLHARQRPKQLPGMMTAWAGQDIALPVALPAGSRFHLSDERGIHRDGVIGENQAGLAVIPAIAAPGYYKLECSGHAAMLAIAPARCWTFEDAVSGGRLWGPAAQTYGLFSNDHDCGSASRLGIGTFADAGTLAAHAARKGADALMISPAHALFHADVNHYSPYSPSSRFHYNVLLADPAGVFPHNRLHGVYAKIADDCAATGGSSELINWPDASARKHQFLRALYTSFMTYECNDRNNAQAGDFASFKSSGGAVLADHAIFEALHGEQYRADTGKWHWRSWPAALQTPGSAEVKQFAKAHAAEIDYHMFLQWLARRSLEAAQMQAKDAGMRIGLINDLAVGLNGGGSHAWSMQDDLLHGLAIGAPPDALAPRGQNWGLTTFNPFALQDSGFDTFLSTLRACLEPTGGARIDHVMGLMRLWLIPESGEAGDGGYVSYPFDDMLRLTVLASWRSKKVIIGEDLGTVPLGFREKLGRAGLAGMRVLLFERDGHGYRPPGDYPAEAIAMPTTHDTPTLLGWQRSLDIALREPLDQLPPGQTADMARQARTADKADMRRAFGFAGLARGALDHMPGHHEEQRFAASAIQFTAQTLANFVAIPLEDLAGQIEQPNLPGTTTEHPNWRRRYIATVETILDEEPASAHVALLQLARPRTDQPAMVKEEPEPVLDTESNFNRRAS